MWVGICRSVQRFATGWTVRGSNPGVGKIFRIRPDLPWGPTKPAIQKIPGLSLGVKRPWRDNDHSPDLAPKLKAEYSYTSIHPLGLHGLSQGELYFYQPQYKSHSFCYADKFSVLSPAFRQAVLLGKCDCSCKIFPTNVISDERRIMSVFSYEAHESRMQRTSLPHLVKSVENPGRCWTLNITCYVQACMTKVKLHSMTAEFVTAKLFSYFSNR